MQFWKIQNIFYLKINKHLKKNFLTIEDGTMFDDLKYAVL